LFRDFNYTPIYVIVNALRTLDHPNPYPHPKSKYIPLEAMLIKNGDRVGVEQKLTEMLSNKDRATES